MNQLTPYEFEQYLNAKNFCHFRFQSADQPNANKDTPAFDLHFDRVEIFHTPETILFSYGFNSMVIPLFCGAEVDEDASMRGTVLLLHSMQTKNNAANTDTLILANK